MKYELHNGRVAKKENKTANENELQKCKTVTKDDYENVKILLGRKIFFIPLQNVLLCRTPRQAL